MVMRILNQVPKVIVIGVVLTTITSIVIFNNQATTGSSDDGGSIFPKYREGYEVGKVEGKEDSRGGKEHDDKCPQEKVTILWCIGYEMGYNDGYYEPQISGGTT